MSRVQKLQSACEGGDYLAGELLRAWELEYQKFVELDQQPWSEAIEAPWLAANQRNADYARAWDILERLRRQTRPTTNGSGTTRRGSTARTTSYHEPRRQHPLCRIP